MTDVAAIVDGLDLVVGLADGHLHPDDLAAARGAARRARDRVGHLGGTLVAALLGGTGAGKSSLLNALAGERIASTSAVRPHTTRPLAWVPRGAEPALGGLLDRVGIDHRVEQDRLPGVALLDMTDVDSLVEGHRHQVEAVLPMVDVGIWVLDPLKYAEGSLHRDFIRPAAASADRLIFVLNQVDRIPPDERGIVRSHLIEVLQGDGIGRPRVFEVASDPPIGPRIGVDALLSHLRERLDEKRVHLGRVVEDARITARRVARATGVSGGGSLEFEERWAQVLGSAVAALSTGGASVGVLEEVLRSVEHLVGTLSGIAGGAFGLRVRQAFNPDRIEREVLAAVAAMEEAAPSGGSAATTLVRTTAATVVEQELQERIGAPLRTLLWERASLSAVVAGLSVDAEMADAHLGIGIDT